MNCLLTSYLSFFYSLLYEWKELDSHEKSICVSSIKESYPKIKGFLSGTDISHLAAFVHAFEIVDGNINVNAEKVYNAYYLCSNCELKNKKCMCYNCDPIIKDFYLLCASALFDTSEISRVDSNWIHDIKSISNESKIKLTPIDPKIALHLNVPRETITKQYIKKLNARFAVEQDYLLVLKSMSSSSPWMYNHTTNRKFSGGGFFLKWQGIGIAIDPGYNFIDNFHNYGCNITDIDYIIITHNHIDHNHDIRIIDDTNKCCWSSSHHVINWIMDKSTYDSNKYYLEDFSTSDGKACNILKCYDSASKTKLFPISSDCKLKVFPTFHIETDTGYSEDSFGIKLDFYSNGNYVSSLGYTSDSKYDYSLVESLKTSDIMIANISGIYEDDIKKLSFKKRHLGYHGCFNLLKELKDSVKLFLLSEFWSGNDDIRFDVAKYMKSELDSMYPDNNIKLYPADTGMRISLHDYGIKCSICKQYSTDTQVIRPKEDYDTLEYICSNCIL